MKANTRVNKGLETKHHIVQTALALIADQGLNHFSAQKLATAAGVSKSNLFHHFTSLDEIVSAVFDALTDGVLSHQEVVIPLNGISLNHVIEALGDQVFNLRPDQEPIYIALMQFYQIALIDGAYSQRLIHIKNQVAKQTQGLLLQWASEHSKTMQNGQASYFFEDFSARLTTLIDALLMTLDAMGMYYMMDRNKAYYQGLWQTQASIYANFLLQAKYTYKES